MNVLFSSTVARSGVLLALDHGDQRIGVALSDAEQRHALVFGVVSAQPEERALGELQRLVKAHEVVGIIVGLPLTLEGKEGPQAQKVRWFVERLRAAIHLPVSFVDERFTSADASRIAAEKGTAPDAEAARLMLDAWLGAYRG